MKSNIIRSFSTRFKFKEVLLLSSFLFGHLGWSTKVFVQSQTAIVNETKSLSKEHPLSVLVKGAELEKIGEEGLYVKVRTADNKEGYIAKLFVKDTKPLNEVADNSNLEKVKGARDRASSYQETVSASARGLNAQDRTRTGRDGFVEDSSAVEEMMNFSSRIGEDDVSKFKKAGDLI